MSDPFELEEIKKLRDDSRRLEAIRRALLAYETAWSVRVEFEEGTSLRFNFIASVRKILNQP